LTLHLHLQRKFELLVQGASPLFQSPNGQIYPPPHQIANNPNQITPDCAADAAIIHLKDFFIGIND